MARGITIRCAVICTLALSVGVFSVIGVGVGVAESDTNKTEAVTITTSGESEDIFSDKNQTSLENVSIRYDYTKDDILETNIFISLSELEEKNIDPNSSKISDYNISGASVRNINKLEHQGHTIFKIQAIPNRVTGKIIINRIVFSNIDMSDVDTSFSSKYKIGTSINESGKNYADLKEEDQIVESRSFDIVSNTIKVPNQATISSQMLSDSTTSAGITITEFVSDVESVILITQGYNGTRLAGFETQSATSVSGRQNISIRPNIVGGKKSVHVIPRKYIDMTNYETGDHIPDSILNRAISSDTTYVYSGTVRFPNQTHNNTISSNITIKEAKLLDLNGDSTPYIISIHPLTSDGEIVRNHTYGYSRRLTGKNDNVKIDLKSQNSTNSKIYTSNQLAATLQIYRDDAEKYANPLDSTHILPNSDIKDRFVNGGISDTARINVNRGTEPTTEEIHINRSSIQPRIYSGSTIIANNTLLGDNSRKLYRVDENKSVISAVGTPVGNTSSVKFSTTGLQTGKYTFNKNRSEINNSFKIIGVENRYTDLHKINGSSTNGDYISLGLRHNTPKPTIQLANVDTNTTAATINLATPKEGRTTLGVNTYAATIGSLNESVTVTGPGASIESVTTPGENGTLPPGTYEIEVRSEQGIATTSDNATMTLTRRSTNGLTTYAGTEPDRSELGSAAAVRDAIKGDALSRAERVGPNETVVYAVNASGLTGLPAARNATPETGADLAALDGLEFGVRSTAGEDGVTASGASGDTPRDSTVHIDETGLYLVTEAEDAFSTDAEPEPGEAFTAEFRVTDDRLREVASDPPDGHRVTSTVTFAGADQGDLPVDSGERIASGEPVAGGGSGGAGRTGGASGTGGVSGGTTGGSGATGPAGGDRRSGPDADGAAGSDGSGDRADPTRGVGFGPRPSAERRIPLLDGPIAVSVPTGARASGTSETSGTGMSGGDVGTTDPKATEPGTDGTGGSETTSNGPVDDGSERPTPTYENAPIRATAEDVPGFGPLHSLAALSLAILAAVRGRRGR